MATGQVPIVLVVEDEALIRMLAHETLSEVGMHVLEAAHGGERPSTSFKRGPTSALSSRT